MQQALQNLMKTLNISKEKAMELIGMEKAKK